MEYLELALRLVIIIGVSGDIGVLVIHKGVVGLNYLLCYINERLGTKLKAKFNSANRWNECVKKSL